jgi:hypothetical protein
VRPEEVVRNLPQGQLAHLGQSGRYVSNESGANQTKISVERLSVAFPTTLESGGCGASHHRRRSSAIDSAMALDSSISADAALFVSDKSASTLEKPGIAGITFGSPAIFHDPDS